MAKKKKSYDEQDGVWRTIGGRRVFIRTGQSLSDAMKESGKFEKTSGVKREQYRKVNTELQKTELSKELAREIYGKGISDEVAERYGKDLIQLQEGTVTSDLQDWEWDGKKTNPEWSKEALENKLTYFQKGYNASKEEGDLHNPSILEGKHIARDNFYTRKDGNKEEKRIQSLAKMYDVNRETAEKYQYFPKDIQNVKKHGGAGHYDESEFGKKEQQLRDIGNKYATNNGSGSDDNTSAYADKALDYWRKQREDTLARGGNTAWEDDSIKRWEKEKENRLYGEKEKAFDNEATKPSHIKASESQLKRLDKEYKDAYDYYDEAMARANEKEDLHFAGEELYSDDPNRFGDKMRKYNDSINPSKKAKKDAFDFTQEEVDKAYQTMREKMQYNMDNNIDKWSAKTYTNAEFLAHLEDANWHGEMKQLEDAKLSEKELEYIKNKTTLSSWGVGEELTGRENVSKMIQETKEKFRGKDYGYDEYLKAKKTSSLRTRYSDTIKYLKQTTDMSEEEILEMLRKRGK